MAGVPIDAASTLSSLSTDDADRKPVLLRYPTIELKTSFESLLSNSTSSSGTARMPRSSVPPADLDESWASLDTSDFSHDDDQSENAETGSLVDLCSNHDAESAVEDETQSETNIEDEQAASLVVCEPSQADEKSTTGQQDRQDEDDVEDTIILQRSMIQDHPDTINLEYTRSLPSSTVPGQGATKTLVQEMIHMTVSKHQLNLHGQPFNVAYYGTASAKDTRDELLGKVGAALVVASSASSSHHSPSSPMFNIIPTEFGPGSKPAFADLIPSQAQMTVEDLTVLRSTPNSPSSVKFGFKRGVIFESKSVKLADAFDNDPWRPDLLIIHISRDDAAEDYCTVKEVFELARRHHWPTITVTKEQMNGLCPSSSCYGITLTQVLEADDSLEKIVQPIDLDNFVAVDTDQLNRHLNYLKERSHRSLLRDRLRAGTSPLQKICEFLKIPVLQSGKQKSNIKLYSLRIIEPTSKNPQTDPTIPSIFETLKQYWSTVEGRQMFKDIFLTFTVILLVTYILSFSQALTKGNPRTIGAGSASQDSRCTATVTASSFSTSTTATNVPLIEHDVMVYDPISFDQVWNRLTGRPTSEQQQKNEPELDEKPPEEIKPAEVRNGKQDLVDAVHNLLHSIADVLNPVDTSEQPNNNSPKEPSRKRSFSEMFAQRKKFRSEKQAQIREMHEKLDNLWSDVSKNVKDFGKQSQDHFDDLVRRSHRHLRRAQWVGEKRLEKLVKEQKKLLSRAQHQANTLTHEMPPKKKRGFSGCGKFW